MRSPFDLSSQLADFTGTAPLFPLPSSVLFPHILLPLHVFEPRYREMTRDALAGPRLIAMAHLMADSSKASGGICPIHSTVCLGKIAAEERLPDGRFYLVLQGLSRARLIEETPQGDRPYRVGRLELLSDDYPDPPVIDRDWHVRKILCGLRHLFPEVQIERMLEAAPSRQIPLGVLCDVLAYAMKLPACALQDLLQEVDVDQRSRAIVRHLEVTSRRESQRAKPTSRVFPPHFSLN